jgi:hypothetical protein
METGIWCGSYINDLEALLKKLVRLIGEMVPDTVFRGCIRLVDMNSACWAPELSVYIAGI